MVHNPYHTRMVIPYAYIRVWYVPYAYGINTRMVQNTDKLPIFPLSTEPPRLTIGVAGDEDNTYTVTADAWCRHTLTIHSIVIHHTRRRDI